MIKTPIKERFWSKVELFHGITDEDCWNWTGSKTPKGYGMITERNDTLKAHRVSWEMRYGKIENNLCVLHRCDVPSCVNPSHLFLGTITDNNKDMIVKGRNNNQLATHCKRNHPLQYRKNGRRWCPVCERRRQLLAGY